MRTVILSDTFALATLSVRPEGMWDIDWADQRNKNLLSPEYGIQYVASYLKKRGHDFDVVNVIAGANVSVDFFSETSQRSLVDTSAADELDVWLGARWLDVLHELRRRDPDVIFYPLAYYFMIHYCTRLLRDVRDACPRATIIVGGNYATLHADECAAMPEVDYVVVGEGEHTANELLRALADERPIESVDGLCYESDGLIIWTPGRVRENDLDTFPHLYTVGAEFLIRRRHDLLCELIPYGDYWPGTSMVTARGCPEKCSFCLDPAIWNRKVKFHSAAYVAETVRFCKENYPSDHNRFFFGDSTFTLRWNRLEPMLDQLADIGYSYSCQTRADALDERRVEKMAASGWVTIGIGAESLNNDVLNDVALKREDTTDVTDAALACREQGIQPILTLIAGFPGESRESMIETVDRLRVHGFHVSSFFPLVVFRGLKLFEGFEGVEGFTESGMFYERRGEARLNEWSDEWFRLSDEFPTKADLVEFTAYLNHRVRLPIGDHSLDQRVPNGPVAARSEALSVAATIGV